MKKETHFEVPVDDQIVTFSEHIDDPQNERIIFSGIFGIGKSYFLERFFEFKEDKYVTIKLSPVNYSISSNDDIFRLLKYDILYELIVTHKLELEQETIDRHIAYGTILSSKTGSLLESFLSAAQLLNKGIGSSEELPNPAPLINFLSRIATKVEAVEKDRKDANLNQRILSFISSQESSVLFESDFITGFIMESLHQLASKSEQKKETVLVIDDLDRIDPEHIFRLFNLFSSHLNYRKSTGNKFGFDKVVFVCDIENIRNIFSARYGESTDFSGYIDKFYSTEIFHFDNSEKVAAITDKLIESMDFGNRKTYVKNNLAQSGQLGLLNFLLKYLIDCGSLNMRRIKSVYNSNYNFQGRRVRLIGCKRAPEIWHIPAVVAFEILNKIYSDIAALEKALTKLVLFDNSRRHDNPLDFDTRFRMACYFIPLLDGASHDFEAKSPPESEKLVIELEGKKIPYNLGQFGEMGNKYYAHIKGDEDYFNNQSTLSANVFKLVLDAFNVLKASGYFYK